MQEQQTQPLVSVVMATYNGERFLDEQLWSIRNQTYTNLEIIVVDDASADSTVDILRRHAEEDDRMCIHVNDSNQGTNSTFEKGFSLAQGEFIAISDQDDVWDIKKIDILVERIGSSGGIYTNSRIINSDGNNTGVLLRDELGIEKNVFGNDFLRLLYKNSVPGHALLVKKSIINLSIPFSKNVEFYYDHQLAILCMMNGGLFFIEEALVGHRIHEKNQVHAFKRKSHKTNKDKLHKNRRIFSNFITSCEFISDNVNRNISAYRNNKTVLFYAKKFSEFSRKLSEHNTLFKVSFLFFLIKNRESVFFSQKRKFKKCIRLISGVIPPEK